jgi:hypothetical protein
VADSMSMFYWDAAVAVCLIFGKSASSVICKICKDFSSLCVCVCACVVEVRGLSVMVTISLMWFSEKCVSCLGGYN